MRTPAMATVITAIVKPFALDAVKDGLEADGMTGRSADDAGRLVETIEAGTCT